MQIAIIIISGFIAALVTFYLNNRLQLGGVMASAAISVLVGGFFYLYPNLLSDYYTTNIPLVVMGASFIGMATSKVVRQYWIIGISGFIFSVLYLSTGSFFEGFGGGLGSTAAISLCSAYVLKRFLTRKKISKPKA
ncbi:hypothetical protein C8P64_3241 [Christiangramia gaetbulicola]|uniref:Uncharacterized protein n=1 Tax=Christiangramia gaetbulicola TaxID=703340 RepID=A0A2T6AC99_9FLAO|nr:hypothetical protein [Christiangramia gaetbulicola]PTX41441.1 hypothetical protein C8P64_3241 [Christiangramia gaetbulicola]